MVGNSDICPSRNPPKFPYCRCFDPVAELQDLDEPSPLSGRLYLLAQSTQSITRFGVEFHSEE